MKRWILTIGIVMIIFLLGIIGIYEWKEQRYSICAVDYPTEDAKDMTIEGYEDADELIAYMIYQISVRNLDYSLRGCAFKDIAECFHMSYYTEYLQRFERTKLIAPSDADSPAYFAISNAKLAAKYAQALDQFMDMIPMEGSVRLIGIIDDVPENPDGLYYQNREQICEILGARSLAEKIVYLDFNGQIKELRCSLVRYRKYWKVLFFHPLEDTGVDVIDLKESEFTGNGLINLEKYSKDVLPCNFFLLSDNKEQDARTVIKRFFTYLQREDVKSAMSYMDYGIKLDNNVSTEILEKQGKAAYLMQEFYYKTLLHDEEYLRWIFKDISTRGSDLTSALSTTNMLFVKIEELNELYNDGKTASYDLGWSYEEEWIWAKLTLENQGGWKIKDIFWY